MPLTNFGAILNFAETLEREDTEFYRDAEAADVAESYRILFEMFVREGKKNLSLVQRTRRENVTEMILEPIRDLTRARYQKPMPDAGSLDLKRMLAAAMALEERAVRYYNDAGKKIRALPEVSRTLKTLAKKRSQRIAQMQRLAGS